MGTLHFVLVSDDEVFFRRMVALLPDTVRCERIGRAACLEMMARGDMCLAVLDQAALDPEFQVEWRRLIAMGAHPPPILQRPAGNGAAAAAHFDGGDRLAVREWKDRLPFVLQRSRIAQFRHMLADRVDSSPALDPLVAHLVAELLLTRPVVRSVAELAKRTGVSHSRCYVHWEESVGSTSDMSLKAVVDLVLLLRVMEAKDLREGWNHLLKHRFGVRMRRLDRISRDQLGMSFLDVWEHQCADGVERISAPLCRALRIELVVPSTRSGTI